MHRRLSTRFLSLAALSALIISASACGGTSAEGFDAAPIRRDTGFVPYDAGAIDHSSQPDTATTTPDAGQVTQDANTNPDSNTTVNDAAQDSDAAQAENDAAVSQRDASVNLEAGSGDSAAPAGLGIPCTGDGDCSAPYSCAIPTGQTQGFCMAACADNNECGRSQVCEAIHESVPGTWCLDVVARGGSCMEVYSRCESGTDCFVTDQDADGNPAAALCKQTCTVGEAASCANGESCMSSGYVDLQRDANNDPVMCDADASVCTAGEFSCMDLRTSDGRSVKACAKELGWCGTAGGPGDSCNEDQDLYCGEMTDPDTNNAQDPAFAVCADQCWYLCFVPAAYTNDGQDHSYDCADGMACVQGPTDIFPEGVNVCDHGFDAGVVTTEDGGNSADAAVEDAGTSEDAGAACEPCGNVTFIGACNQDELTWCGSDNCLHSQACDQQVVGGSALHCSEFSADWGYDCLAAEGGSCNPDYPAQPSNPNAPTSPGCDPGVGSCNPVTFVCGAVPDGGFPREDAGSEDGGSSCLPCTLNDGTEVTGSGTCADNLLVWCGADGCLQGFDCGDTSRTCFDVTVTSGTDSYPWADCFGSTGAACVDGNTYFGNLENAYTDPNWLCDPDTSCDTNTNTCL